VPKVVPTVAEQRAVKQARQVYEGSLASAVRDYTEAGKDAEAAEVQSQWDDMQLVTYDWQTKVEGIDEVWSFGRTPSGEWSVSGVYYEGGKQVGTKTNGLLSFRFVLVDSPRMHWTDSDAVVTHPRGKATMTWTTGAATGTRELQRLK
jgi:hypothetical protein